MAVINTCNTNVNFIPHTKFRKYQMRFEKYKLKEDKSDIIANLTVSFRQNLDIGHCFVCIFLV